MPKKTSKLMIDYLLVLSFLLNYYNINSQTITRIDWQKKDSSKCKNFKPEVLDSIFNHYVNQEFVFKDNGLAIAYFRNEFVQTNTENRNGVAYSLNRKRDELIDINGKIKLSKSNICIVENREKSFYSYIAGYFYYIGNLWISEYRVYNKDLKVISDSFGFNCSHHYEDNFIYTDNGMILYKLLVKGIPEQDKRSEYTKYMTDTGEFRLKDKNFFIYYINKNKMFNLSNDYDYSYRNWVVLDLVTQKPIISSSMGLSDVTNIYENNNYYKARFFKVRKNGLYGILDSNFKLVVPFEYEKIEDKRNGHYIVKKRTVYGALDSNFKLVIPLTPNRIDYVNQKGKPKKSNERFWNKVDEGLTNAAYTGLAIILYPFLLILFPHGIGKSD